MCGIFAYFGKKTNAAELTLAGLKMLEYRGYDSWGIAVKNSKGILELEKHTGKIGDAKTTLPSATLTIGHTRWATHGGVTDENAHPHLNSAKTIAVVHNGIVENYRNIKTTLLKDGIEFSSETDTEVIVHLIDTYIKKGLNFTEAVRRTFLELVGSNAIVAISAAQDEIVACCNGSPIVVGVSPEEFLLASDVTALLPYTKNVYFLEHGDCVVLSRTGVKLLSLSSGLGKEFKTQEIDWTLESSQKGDMPHYMIKEILEQKDVLPKTIMSVSDSLKEHKGVIGADSEIILSGCGSAYHCALLGTYFFAEVGKIARAVPANEFEPFAKLCTKDTIFVAISQSGETADTLIAAKLAKAFGAKIVAIVNARSSSLERMADVTIPVGAGPEIAVVSTKAFVAQVTALYLLANPNKENLDISSKLEDWFNSDVLSKIQDLATTLLSIQDIYVIGKYMQYPTALEVALKIKETSYIHSEGFAAGELKHGVISLIQKGTPVIVLAQNDEVKNEVLSSATELASRGAHIIGVAPFSAPEFATEIIVPDLGSLTGLSTIIFGQLLSYYLAVGRGCDPDKPRNLAKSVTVK